MADKTIGELPGISYLDAGSLFVAEQSGQAVKVSGKQLTDFSNVETTAQVEQAKASAQEAKTAQAAAEAAILKGPIIQNGTWWVYNQTAGAYQDTGINATGPQGIPGPTASVNGISPDASGNITLTAGNVNAYSKTEADTLLSNKAGWSQNNITGSVLDWAKSQTIPTSGYTNMDATDVPYSGYWLVNVLITNVNSNWKVVLVYGITSPVEVWYRVYNYGNWNTEWRKLLNDSLTPSEIGAYTKTETNALLDNKPDKNNGKYLTALNIAHSETPDTVRGKIFTSYDGSGNGIIGIDTFNASDGSTARLMLRANGVFQKLMGDSNGNFGTPDNLAYESQLKYKRMYQCTGLILDGDGCDMQGVGTASVILHYNGVAEVHFSVKITQNSNSGVFKWGINPSLLSARNANIPAITPITHLGVCQLFTDSGAYNLSALQYGGIIEVDAGRWRVARIYTADGAIGGYPCNVLPVGHVITGTCYGYF